MDTNNCLVIGFKAHYAGSNHTGYCTPEQRSVIWGVKGLSGETSATALLNRCDAPGRLLSKHLHLSPKDYHPWSLQEKMMIIAHINKHSSC